MQGIVNIAEEILRKRKIDHWEILLQNSEGFRVETKKLEVDFLQKANLSGIAIRIIENERMGFSFTSNLTYESLKNAVDIAESIAASSSKDPDHSFLNPENLSVDETTFLDPGIVETEEKEKIHLARALEETVFSYDKRVSAVGSSGYSDLALNVEIRNSLGLQLTGTAGLSKMWVELMVQKGSNQELGYWSEQSRTPQNLDPIKIGKTAAQRALSKLGGHTIPSTKCSVLIENIVAASLLETLSNSFLAESHFKSTASPRVQVGLKSFSPLIDIFDNGLDPRGTQAFSFDGEGAPSQNTTLVKSGLVERLLADCYYGKKIGALPTGNCRRPAFDTPPFNGITNLFIGPGNLGKSDLLHEVGSGIMITEVMGLHTANPISGDFSVGASGFKIFGGRLSHPVRGIALAGNLIDVFGQITALGNDLQFFANVGAPSLVVKSLSISGE
ncbi:MAG: TldD/PmbA family protein [Pseudomonadota bacterium]